MMEHKMICCVQDNIHIHSFFHFHTFDYDYFLLNPCNKFDKGRRRKTSTRRSARAGSSGIRIESISSSKKFGDRHHNSLLMVDGIVVAIPIFLGVSSDNGHVW